MITDAVKKVSSTSDPASLQAVWWGIDHLEDAHFGLNGTLEVPGIPDVPSGEWKCNAFG
jgi:hypothetical protein